MPAASRTAASARPDRSPRIAQAALGLLAAALAPGLALGAALPATAAGRAPAAGVAGPGATAASAMAPASAMAATPTAGRAMAAPAAVAAPAAPSADVRQPAVQQVALGGVDRAVARLAPRPEDEHAPGQLHASAAHVATRLAAAASVAPGRAAELIAVTADTAFPAGSSVQVRVREGGRWSRWTTLSVDADHAPDPGTAEARRARVGSDPLLATNASRVQVRIDTPSGRLPRGARLTLVDAPVAASDAQAGRGQLRAAAVGQPPIITRAQWGANEAWRSRAPWYTDDLRAGFVHHTASTSNYSPEQAAAQVRAIYAYHTRSLGHSDIDYNFVVDRFGRLYEGRAGGIDRPVLGGHTAGFNEHSFAVVALGNFSTFNPPAGDKAAMNDSIARLFAWKLGLHGVSPAATVQLESAGYKKATRYPRGSLAALPAVSSHQMVNYTACPGSNLQAQLPAIRSAAANLSDVVLSAPSPTGRTLAAGTGAFAFSAFTTRPLATWTADILSPCSDTPVRTITGGPAGAGQLDATWDLRDASGTRVLPATYTVRVSGTTAEGTVLPPVTATVTLAPAPGGAWGPCANVSRVLGSTPAGTSVLWGRVVAPGSPTVVLSGAGGSTAAFAAGLAAAPLARSLGAPLLLTPPNGLASEVLDDLRARGARAVFIVGGEDVVSAAVASAVAGLGVAVTRLSGATPAATAAAVAGRMPASAPAVLVSPDGSPAHAIAGAALAAAQGGPLLLASGGTIPAETGAGLGGRPGVTVVASPALPDAAVTAAVGGSGWTRIAAGDAVAAGVAVAAAVPAGPTWAALLSEDPASWVAAAVPAAAGVPVLFTSGQALPAGVADLLRATPALGGVVTPVGGGWIPEAVLGGASRALVGPAWAPPGVALGATRPPVVAVYRVGTTNASPEPVRKGRTLKVTSSVTLRGPDKRYRKVPAGVAFTVQFRATGAKRWATVASGITTTGRATARVGAARSGTWRVVVGTKAARGDWVRVRR